MCGRCAEVEGWGLGVRWINERIDYFNYHFFSCLLVSKDIYVRETQLHQYIPTLTLATKQFLPKLHLISTFFDATPMSPLNAC